MSQYRDPFIGERERESRDRNGEYRYQRREEDDDFHYSGDTRYGFGVVPITDIGSHSSNRPAQQPRRPRQPVPPGQKIPIPPVPRAPSNSSNGNRGPPLRPARQNYVPSDLDSSEVQEVRQNQNFSYRLNEQPVRYSQQSEYDSEISSPANRPSVSSSRDIFIGFDPSNSPATANSLGVIPNFPPAPPPIPSGPNRKSGSGPPPSARRGTLSSYYSQQPLMVSPIPEESLTPSDRHGSYASSAAIPTDWSANPTEFYIRDDILSDYDDYDSRNPIGNDIDIDIDIEEERGLVRQASLGRKSKPVITEIQRSKNTDQSGSKSLSSNEIFRTSRTTTGAPLSSARAIARSPAEKSSPALNSVAAGSGSSLQSARPVPQAQSPVSSTSADSPTISPYAFGTDDGEFTFPRRLSRLELPGAIEGSAGTSASSSPWESPGTVKFPATAASVIPGRRIPPRLNIDVVREAEARGSLTSLPDLIRRATKLAAVLETGRPDSRWGMRGSFMGNSSNSRSNGKDTDSISDILASFPPPVLAHGKNNGSRVLSQWPLPGDFTHENNSSIRPSRKQGRRVCGLPLWAFVLLVILALLVISAAVIVPLQLVNLSKKNSYGDSDSASNTLVQCKEKNPCLNGGENIATTTNNFCGCVCTNGFTGSNCSQKNDLSCTTVDLKDGKDGKVMGIQNVTMGSALPRLFDMAEPLYNIKLNMVMVLAVFNNKSISCTAQNALVTFNGKATPSTTNPGKRALVDTIAKRQDIVIDTTPEPSPTGTIDSSAVGNRVPELDPDAVDFGRVVVLYLTNAQTLKSAGEAQNALQTGFTAGKDFGDLPIGNNITVDFDNRSIELPNGDVIGGVAINATSNLATTSGKRKRCIVEACLSELPS